MSQMKIDFDLPERNPLMHKPHELYNIVVATNYEHWERLAQKYTLEQLFPKGTDLSRVPYWIHRIFDA